MHPPRRGHGQRRNPRPCADPVTRATRPDRSNNAVMAVCQSRFARIVRSPPAAGSVGAREPGRIRHPRVGGNTAPAAGYCASLSRADADPYGGTALDASGIARGLAVNGRVLAVTRRRVETWRRRHRRTLAFGKRDEGSRAPGDAQHPPPGGQASARSSPGDTPCWRPRSGSRLRACRGSLTRARLRYGR